MKHPFLFRHLSALLALSFWLTAAPVRAERAETLTLMVFMCGSNLESGSGAATADLMEMASSGYDLKHVNLLVMTGGTTFWQLGLPTDALCIYQPGRGALRMLTAFEDMSMGTPEALEALLCFGYERCPADRYALILWDHGAGPLEGVCWDERYNGDRLTMEELTLALSSGPAAREPLEWIGFDACLMAATEVASTVSPYARYMVASQETEPGSGWNYAFLGDLASDHSGAAAGRCIIDRYFDSGETDEGLTLSCLDLSALKDLEHAMDTFFGGLEISSVNYALYSYAAHSTRTYGRAVSGSGGYDLVDLSELIRHLSSRDASGAAAVEAALNRVVSFSRSADGLASGLSVYHPYENKADYAASWAENYPALHFSEGYTQYIGDFAAYLFGEQQLSWEGLTLVPTDREHVYALPLTERQRSMLSDAALDLLLWDAGSRLYAPVGSVPCLAIDENSVYAADPGHVLKLASEDAASSEGIIPWEPAADGKGMGIYVSFCRSGSDRTPEALRIVPVNTASERKTFGESDIAIVSGGTESQDASSLGQTDQAGLSSDAEITVSHAEVFSSALARQSAVEVAFASPQEGVVLSQAIPLSMQAQSVLGQAETASLMTSLPLSAAPQPLLADTIVPVKMDSSPDLLGEVTYTGSAVTLDMFSQLDLSVFDPGVVEIDLAGYSPAESPAAVPDVIHTWGRCSISEEGEVRWEEIWVYDAGSDRWSRGSWPDRSLWPTAVFPRVWHESASSGEALAGLDQWPAAFTDAACVTDGDLSLRFVPAEQPYCLAFRLTDRQNLTHECLPVAVQPSL